MSREKTNPPEYGTELKLAAVRRVLAGESVSAERRNSAFDESGCMCGRTVMRSRAKPAWRIGGEEGRER
jgi:hypothetical protein